MRMGKFKKPVNRNYLMPQVCDGIQNCAAGLDECQSGCIKSVFSNEESMIEQKAVLVFIWIFSMWCHTAYAACLQSLYDSGIAALIGCGLVALITIQEIAKFKKVQRSKELRSRRNAKINKALIMNLSISDLLVGVSWSILHCFQKIITVTNDLPGLRLHSLCKKRRVWRTILLGGSKLAKQ